MDSLKTLTGGSNLSKKIQERWKIAASKIVDDGSKYGGPNDTDRVHNPIVGFAYVSEIKDLERRGVIVWSKNSWRVPREEIVMNGKIHYAVSSRYIDWRRQKNGPSREMVAAERSATPALVRNAEKILGGRVVREYDVRNITGGE